MAVYTNFIFLRLFRSVSRMENNLTFYERSLCGLRCGVCEKKEEKKVFSCVRELSRPRINRERNLIILRFRKKLN